MLTKYAESSGARYNSVAVYIVEVKASMLCIQETTRRLWSGAHCCSEPPTPIRSRESKSFHSQPTASPTPARYVWETKFTRLTVLYQETRSFKFDNVARALSVTDFMINVIMRKIVGFSKKLYAFLFYSIQSNSLPICKLLIDVNQSLMNDWKIRLILLKIIYLIIHLFDFLWKIVRRSWLGFDFLHLLLTILQGRNFEASLKGHPV